MPRTMNALDLLRQDHQHVQALLKRFEKTEDEGEQRELCDQIVGELREHTEIEERILYPYLREATGREDLFEEASLEHDTAKSLMEQLEREQPGTPRFKAMVKVLGEYVEHHVQEEEAEIFPQVEKTGVDLDALGQTLEECRSGEKAPLEAEAGEEAVREGPDEQLDFKAPTRKDDERFLKQNAEGLSRSTQRARWIHEPGEQPERDGQTLATRHPEVIRAWAEARSATPATSPNGDPENPRVLRFDFPGFDKSLLAISWEAWIRTFQDRNLAFVFQETTRDGRQSNFFLLDSPEREDG